MENFEQNQLNFQSTPTLQFDPNYETDTAGKSSSIVLKKPGEMTSNQEIEFAKQYGLELSPQEQNIVNQYASMVDITNSAHVTFFGADAQKKIAEFSNQTLESVKAKDLGSISDQLTGLVAQLTTMSPEEPKGFFGKLFKKAEINIVQLRANYESAAQNVERITRNLENHQVTLLQDVSMFDQMYNLNREYFKELTLYIIAGKKALETARNVKGVQLKEKANRTGQPQDAQEYNDFMNMCDRFEKKLYDLELTRNVSIQMGPQIRLLQNNDQELVEKIQTVIVNTIPLWKNQMVVSLGLANSQRAMAAQRAVTDATNDMMRKNAEMLHQGSVDIAREMERGVIDIETLKQTNQSLIDTLTDIQKVQNEGREKRRQAEQDLQVMKNNLKNKLIEMSRG